MTSANPKHWKYVDRIINTGICVYLIYSLVSTWKTYIPPSGKSKIYGFTIEISKSFGGFLILMVLFGAIVAGLVFTFFRNDEVTDPIWRRGLRAVGFICTAIAIFLLAHFWQ